MSRLRPRGISAWQLWVIGLGSLSGGCTSSRASAHDNHAGRGAPASGVSSTRCASPSLVWRTAHKTHYESFPDPGSVECVEYNGCQWAGWFAGCRDKQTEQWVASHDIAAMFPGFDAYMHHDLCIRSGERSMVVTVYDTCADSDCDGCCTRNQGDADALIDLESHTNQRWGLVDGSVEWADLGPSAAPGCVPN